MKQRNILKLTCVTADGSAASGSSTDKPSQRSRASEASSGKSSSTHSSKEATKSPSKKTSKHLDARSPTKKSLDYLSKIAAADEENAESSKGDISSPGIRKYTRDISDVAGKRLPHIPEHEIQEFMVEEDLPEIERVKILLRKDNNDQLSYFFNNIESIFKIKRPQFHSLFGNDYDSRKQRAKNYRYNYETQSRYGSFLRIQSSIRTDDNVVDLATQHRLLNPSTKLKVREIVVDGGDEEADDETKESEKRSQNQQQAGQVRPSEAASQIQSTAAQGLPMEGAQPLEDSRREYHQQLQAEVLPLILENKWIEGRSEYMQILTGEAFLALLKSQQVDLTLRVLLQIKDESIDMLQQWSADILEIWTEVYTLTLAALTRLKRRTGEPQDLESAYLQCKQTVQKMSDRNQTIKVRIKAASLVGQLAKYDSLGDPERFRQFFLSKLQYQCQDLHWEVRKEMCSHLINVSRYIGPGAAEEKVLPEIKELLEDEEGEVVTEAIAQFQKHVATVFSYQFVSSQEAIEIFCKFCDLTLKNEMCGIDLAIVLKKLGKIIVTLDRPQDPQVVTKIENLVTMGMRSNQDEEIRAMVPCTFEGIVYLYRDNIQVLLDLYEKHFSAFIQNEIKKGQKEKKKDKMDSARSSQKNILYDLLENEKQTNKYYREDNNDMNYLVNRSIAQNLHFFFGAFVQVFKSWKKHQEQELVNELCSPSTFSAASVNSPAEIVTKDGKHLGKNLTPTANALSYDRVRLCLTDILESYRCLLETKDQELMHHVLFSFDCYHSELTKINVWQSTYKKGLGDGVRDLYLDIVRNYIIPAEAVVQNCWRYHLTYLKVIESLIDSSERYNEDFAREHSFDGLGSKVALAHISQKVKPFNTHFNSMDALQIVFSNVHATSGELPSVSHLKAKKIKLQNQTNTAQQVRSYAFEILARQLTQNKSAKVRGKIVDFTTRLIKFRTQAAKSAYLGFLHSLIKDDLLSSKFFQQNFFDSFVQVLDDSGSSQNHLKVLRDFSRKVVPLIYEDSLQLDKFTAQISFLKQRCESQATFSPQNQIMKRGNVANLILQEIDEFQAYMTRKELKDEIREYLRTTDQENLIKEDILNGVYLPTSGNSRDYHSIKDEYVSRNNIQKNSSRTNLSKADNGRKPFSVRASSKGANRDKKLPPSVTNQEKTTGHSQIPSTSTTGQQLAFKENKTIQQTFEILDQQQQDGKRRLKSLRPPSQPFQRRSVQPSMNVKEGQRQQREQQLQSATLARARQSSQSPRAGVSQQPSPSQRMIGSKKHNSNMDVLAGQGNPGRPANGSQNCELVLPVGKPPKVHGKSDPKKLEESDTSDSDEENQAVRAANSRAVYNGVASNPTKERRLSSLSSALSDQENEASSNATHSEKITKRKGAIVDNYDMGRASLGTKASGVTSASTSTKVLPPRTKGVPQHGKQQNIPPSQLVKKQKENTELYLDQKINVLDQYRSTERGVCYTNVIGSDQLLIQQSADNYHRVYDSQTSASSLIKKAQLQNKDLQNGGGPQIIVKDSRNSKSTLSKFSDAKNGGGLNGAPSSNSRATYHTIMNNVLSQTTTPASATANIKKGNIQLNNKIQSKLDNAAIVKPSTHSQQVTLEAPSAEMKMSYENSRPTSSHYDAVGSSYFQRNSKLQERYADAAKSAIQKLVTPTNLQPNAAEKAAADALNGFKPVLQSLSKAKPPNTIDMLKNKTNEERYAHGVIQSAPQSGLLKNSKNVNLQLQQRLTSHQSQALGFAPPKMEALEQKFSQFKAETGLVSAFTTKQSPLLVGSEQAAQPALPQRQRLKSLNMNQLPNGAKQFGRLSSSQTSQSNLQTANTPLPTTSTPLPRIDTKEPKTLETGKEAFGLNPKQPELFTQNPLEEISPKLKKVDKLDGTLLTREIAKSNKLKAERDQKMHAKFGAPKEYRPPLGAGAPKMNNGMRGGIGQGISSAYQMKQQQQMNRNSSKPNIQTSQNDSKAEPQPFSAGPLSKNQQKANKRNSDLKKNNQSMLGYLAGTALTRPMTNGTTKSNPIRGAFGTGYKRA